jgi:hypothetical protein
VSGLRLEGEHLRAADEAKPANPEAVAAREAARTGFEGLNAKEAEESHMAVWKRSAALVGPALMVGVCVLVSGCGGGALDTSCGEYMERDEKTQVELAGRWMSPDQNKPDAAASMIGGPWREKLIAYCSGSAHKDTKLSELQPRVGFGP